MLDQARQNIGEPGTLAIVAVAVGALVRVVRTKKADELLARLPFTKPIPKHWLPWVALGLGALVIMLDAKLNGGIDTWAQAFNLALEGALAGAFAIAGHETVVRTPGRVKEYRASMRPDTTPEAEKPVEVPDAGAVPVVDDEVPDSEAETKPEAVKPGKS